MKIQNNPVSLKGKDLLVYMESKLIEQYLEVLSRFSLSFKIGTTIFFFFVEKKLLIETMCWIYSPRTIYFWMLLDEDVKNYNITRSLQILSLFFIILPDQIQSPKNTRKRSLD